MKVLSVELVSDLNAILHAPSYIYVDSIEPDKDRLPVPRFLLSAIIDAFDMSNKQMDIYRDLVRDLSKTLREILAADPGIAGTPTVAWAHGLLLKLEDANQ